MGLLGFTVSYLLFSAIHFCQFILAIVVCGLYGYDLHHANNSGKYSDSKWVRLSMHAFLLQMAQIGLTDVAQIFAEVVGALSAATALLYVIPFILRFAVVWIWNVIIFILWIALFGTFGKLFIHENPEGNGGIQRMKNAVWIDLTNALLWLISAIAHFCYWWTHRERVTRFTGRAKV